MSQRPMVLRGGRVVDPSQGLDGPADILVRDGRIEAVEAGLGPVEDAVEVDIAGRVAAPGFIDAHAHLREPGDEHEETIASGARAAAAGGYTAVLAMPDTDPVVDDPASVGFILAEGRLAGAARVHPVGAITVGQEGQRLTEFGEMYQAGAVAVTDSGRPVMDSGVLRMALEYAQSFGLPVIDHPEDLGLSRNGVMNEGLTSSRLGLRGKPAAAEDVHVLRDLVLADVTGGRLHLQRISTARSVEAIRAAKARGVRVTAEVTPHHLTLTDGAVEGYRTEAKVDPPLRSAADREALRAGLADGTLDVVATDHAPQHYDEKERAFDDAPCGVVGLETAFPVCMELVWEGLLDLATLVERMSCAPARAFGLRGGTLRTGAEADLVVFDPEARWTVDPARFVSRSRNSAFAGREVRGRVLLTVVGGRVVFKSEDGLQR